MQPLLRFHLKTLLNVIVLHLEFAINLRALRKAAAPARLHPRQHKLVLFFSDDPQVTGTSASRWQRRHYSVHISPRGTSRIVSCSAPVSSPAVPPLARSSEWTVSACLPGSQSSTSWSQVLHLPQLEAPPCRWACRLPARWGGQRCSCRCRWGWAQRTWSRSPPVQASENSDVHQTRSCFLQMSQHHKRLEPTSWWRSSNRLQVETSTCHLDDVYTV